MKSSRQNKGHRVGERKGALKTTLDVMVTGKFMIMLMMLGLIYEPFLEQLKGLSVETRIHLFWIVGVLGVALMLVSVGTLLKRAIVDLIRGRANQKTFTSGGFFFLYFALLMTAMPDSWFLGLVGTVLFFVAMMRTGNLPWLTRMMEFLRPSASVNRPDVLGKNSHTQAVIESLPFHKNTVFCGEIQSGDQSIKLYASEEDRGIVIGPPGTGKTGFMVTQLLDLSERKGSFVCLDIKPELHEILREKLEAQGYRIFVFNPTNTSDRYNLLDDLSGPTAIGELAYSLIPSAEGENRAFDEGARDLLDGIISYLRVEKKKVSLPELRKFLAQFSSETELIKTLSQCSDPDVKDTAFAIARSARNARFMGSVFATLRSNLRFLRYGNIRDSLEASDFSLSDFSSSAPVALFLQFEERHQDTTSLLLSVMISHLFTYFIEHTDRPPVLLMLDEIGNVPRIPGFVEKLNTIRSRELPTWMYWQGIHQMQQYGKHPQEGPNQILGACDFQMVFRLNDNDSARWFSERIGMVDRVQYASSYGTNASTTTSIKEEAIVKTSELQSLPAGESIAVYRGKAWRNRATPYFERWPEMARSVTDEGNVSADSREFANNI